jgi:hypothetical protein
MTEAIKQECQSCRFWLLEPTGASWCRRFPATPFIQTNSIGGAMVGQGVVATFVPMTAAGWCGEWRGLITEASVLPFTPAKAPQES